MSPANEEPTGGGVAAAGVLGTGVELELGASDGAGGAEDEGWAAGSEVEGFAAAGDTCEGAEDET